MWKPGERQHSLLHRAEWDDYPCLDFETWYQQGMRCHVAALPKCLRKQAMRAVAKRWTEAGGRVEMWHIRAFVYGSLGLDGQGRRPIKVSDTYRWPEPPDAAWALVVCSYRDGSVEMDFVHPVSRRFWSEHNGFLDQPEDKVRYFSRSWYEEMGFEVMRMMPFAMMAPGMPKQRHLRVIQ